MFGAIKGILATDPEWQGLGDTPDSAVIEQRAKLLLEAAASLLRTDKSERGRLRRLGQYLERAPGVQFAGLVNILLAGEARAALWRERTADVEANERYQSGHWVGVPDTVVSTESLASMLAAAYRGVELDNHYHAVQSGDDWRVEIRLPRY
ncbi:FAD-linked oxidase C-terminal domain-containing protein [Cupriavidus basilensis]